MMKLTTLTRNQLNQLHEASLHILEKVGVQAPHPEVQRHFRKELWFPSLLDRQYYDAWLSGGAKTMAQRCREEKERLLRTHQPVPLPEAVDKELEKILAAARRELEAQGKDWRA